METFLANKSHGDGQFMGLSLIFGRKELLAGVDSALIDTDGKRCGYNWSADSEWADGDK